MTAAPVKIAGSTIRPRWAWSKWYARETRTHMGRLANPDFAFVCPPWRDRTDMPPRASGTAARRDAHRIIAYRRGDAP